MKLKFKKILSGAALGILLTAAACANNPANNNTAPEGTSAGEQGGTLPDSTPKAFHVVSSTPTDGATNSSLNGTMSVTFDQETEIAQVSAHFHVLIYALLYWAPIDGTLSSEDGKTFTFTPAAPLKNGEIYAIQIDPSIQDKEGVSLAQEFRAGFSTPDALAVVSTTPADGAANIPVGSSISVTFDHEMDIAQVNAHFHVLLYDLLWWSPVDGTLTSSDGKTFIFKPTSALKSGAIYGVKIDQTIQDEEGGTLNQEFHAGFKTL